MMPKMLKNFACFIDGNKYVGKVDEIELPKLTLKTEEFRAGGMDAPVDIDQGMERLEGVLTMSGYDSELIKLFGTTKQAVFRGAIQEQGQSAIPVVVEVTGLFKSVDPQSWTAGQKSPVKISYTATLYKQTVNGTVVADIDVINCKRIIGGVDQMASIRSAMGI